MNGSPKRALRKQRSTLPPKEVASLLACSEPPCSCVTCCFHAPCLNHEIMYVNFPPAVPPQAKLARWHEGWQALGGRLVSRIRSVYLEPLHPGHPPIGAVLPTAPATVSVNLPPAVPPAVPYYEVPELKRRISDVKAS